MTSVFGIIQQYKSQLIMLPTVTILFVAATALCYLLFHRYKGIKYFPAAIGIAVGLIFTFYGFFNVTTISGLHWIWRGVYFFVAGCIALASAWLFVLFEGFSKKKSDVRGPVQKKAEIKKVSVAKTGRSTGGRKDMK